MTLPGLDRSLIDSAKAAYLQFIQRTHAGAGRYRLTPYAEPTPYARCFAVFGYHLLQKDVEAADTARKALASAIRDDLERVRQARAATGVDLRRDKPYLQLLTFSLSALAALEVLDADPLAEHVLPLLSNDVDADLQRAGALEGRPRSGNAAMFMAILLIHARDRLGYEANAALERWCHLHRAAANQFGFWGGAASMSHLQFQNGYHQYEIFEYLHEPHPGWDSAAEAVASLADRQGHFAPYPGGGGCFDYDAVFVLTGVSAGQRSRHMPLLAQTADSILSEQNGDGGFAESLRIRPRTLKNVTGLFRHALDGRGAARRERLRQALTLLRPAHDRIHTHWSGYSRGWAESDLWDSWFRMLAVARIDCAFDLSRAAEWGFINFPGIGFHPSVRG